MKLLLVSEGARTLWVAARDDDGRMFAYVQNTRKFHRNEHLERDYDLERDCCYRHLSVERARSAIAAGVGTINEATLPHRIAALRADTAALNPAEVLERCASRHAAA